MWRNFARRVQNHVAANSFVGNCPRRGGSSVFNEQPVALLALIVCYGHLVLPASSLYLATFRPYFACNSRCKRYSSAPGIAATSVPVPRDVTSQIVTAQTHPRETYVCRSAVSLGSRWTQHFGLMSPV